MSGAERVAGEAAAPLRPLRRAEWVVYGLLLVFMVWFYAWTVMTSLVVAPAVSGKQPDYYNLLSHGFLDGVLHMKTTVPQALIDAEDPYDPARRPAGAGLHDATYYKGKYYLYFGATPVVALYLPFRLLTGHDLPMAYGHWIFACIGFLATYALWIDLRRRYFPASGLWVGVLGGLAIGYCGLTLSVLRRPSIWELPISAGYALAFLSLFFFYRGLHARARATWWALSGLCLGLAVGARPVYIAAGAMIVAAPLFLWWGGRQRGLWRWWPASSWWKNTLVLGGTFSAVVGAVMLYNFLRFGSPGEFGFAYQLTGIKQREAQYFSTAYMPFNAYIYFWAPAQWGRYFPFIHFIKSATPPPGYYGIEYPYGILTNMPIVFLALACPLAWWRRRPAEAGLAVFGWGLTVFGAAMSVMLLGFFTGAQRYMVDFTPALVLLALLGMLGLERWVAGARRVVRGVTLTALGGLAAFSVFFGCMAGFELHGLFRVMSPKSYAAVASVWNLPSHAWERLTGFEHGPLELTLRFPKESPGTLQPLVSTGWEFYSDHVFVRYLSDRQIQIGFDHTSHRTLWSAPVEIDFDAPHHLRIEMGSLYPPGEHPFFSGMTDLERASLTRWFRVALDGKALIETGQSFYEAAPESLHLGGVSYTKAYGDRFTGEVLSVKRGDFAPLTEPTGVSGPIVLRLFFPALRDRAQPLIATGEPGKSDTLYVRYTPEGKVKFAYDHWGHGVVESDEITVQSEHASDVTIRMPSLSLSTEADVYSNARSGLLVAVDNKIVWSRHVAFHPAPPDQLYIGRNGGGSSACEPEFVGMINAISRKAEISEPERRRADRVSLKLAFPSRRTAEREPLITRGVAGAADVVFVEYIDPQHLRLAVDHWGVGVMQSEPIPVDYGVLHDLQFEFNETDAGRGEIRAVMDGKEVWRAAGALYPGNPETVSVGLNPIGASSCVETFKGTIVSLSFPSPQP